MGMNIGCAPCCWGVDDVKNPHLPDWKQVLQEASAAGYKGIDAAVFKQVLGEHIAFFAACARGVMCPIGKGVIDYQCMRQTLLDIGYQGYITVEQERDPRNAGSSLTDVTESRNFLQSAGFH